MRTLKQMGREVLAFISGAITLWAVVVSYVYYSRYVTGKKKNKPSKNEKEAAE